MPLREEPACKPSAAVSPTRNNEIFAHEVGGWRRLVLWPLAWLLHVWGATLRFKLTESSRQNLARHDGAMVFVLWHNRLFLAAEIFRRFRQRPVCALVSASRDGAWLTAFFGLAGLRAVRGSSSRGGHGAAQGLVGALRAGHDVGITPDGPRGPRYVFKPGAATVTRLAGADALLIGARFGPAWRLRSWDKFYVPWPWSTVRIECVRVPAAELGANDAAATLAARLREINPDDIVAKNGAAR